MDYNIGVRNSVTPPYQQAEEEVDLCLSLGTSQLHETFHSSGLSDIRSRGYMNLMGWPLIKMNPRCLSHGHSMISPDDDDEETGVESKERCPFVKVNMDGVAIGRKVCIFDHFSYSSLVLQLEDMFGGYCASGLRLFEAESGFSLFYQDRNQNWRTVGDIPWKEFVDCVRRLKIVSKVC